MSECLLVLVVVTLTAVWCAHPIEWCSEGALLCGKHECLVAYWRTVIVSRLMNDAAIRIKLASSTRQWWSDRISAITNLLVTGQMTLKVPNYAFTSYNISTKLQLTNICNKLFTKRNYKAVFFKCLPKINIWYKWQICSVLCTERIMMSKGW